MEGWRRKWRTKVNTEEDKKKQGKKVRTRNGNRKTRTSRPEDKDSGLQCM